jgi:hypothetical protein
MKTTKRENKIIGICAVVVLGTAFIFFVMGCMFTTYNHVQLLGNIKVEEINMDINETLLVDLAYKIAKEEQKSSWEQANEDLYKANTQKR